MKNLFEIEIDSTKNLLPMDGEVFYFGNVFSEKDAQRYFDCLLKTIAWKNDEVVMFGKKIITKRKVAWYGEQEFEYTYSKIKRKAHLFTPQLFQIKKIIEAATGEVYNSCLLNLYHNGEEGMGWHSDAEKDLKNNGAIASVSFGAERSFSFKHKQSKETINIQLENGSLLLMKGITQTHWVHRLPPTKKVRAARINLTFRTIN